ncbi:hypothetical protein ACXHXG_29900 [Rhizobium sp. LEGMi198b]
MKKALSIAVVATAFALLTIAPAASDEPDLVTIDKRPMDRQNLLWELDLTIRTDGLVINSVDVNRGYCPSQEKIPMPVSVSFGQTGAFAHYMCDPIEVQVNTNKGAQTFTWDAYTQGGMSVAKNQDGSWFVTITNRLNSLKIKDVVFNRGNCPGASPIGTFEKRDPNGSLSFGQRAIYMMGCNPIQVDVTTNLGTETFTFDE